MLSAVLYLCLNITSATDEKSQQNVFADVGPVLRSCRNLNHDEFVGV